MQLILQTGKEFSLNTDALTLPIYPPYIILNITFLMCFLCCPTLFWETCCKVERKESVVVFLLISEGRNGAKIRKRELIVDVSSYTWNKSNFYIGIRWTVYCDLTWNCPCMDTWVVCTGVLISPLPNQEGNKLQRQDFDFHIFYL